MTETNESFDTIDLVELFGLLLRRIWTIILAALIAGSLAFGYTYFFVTPLYKASTLLYVNNSDISVGSSSFSITTGDLNAAQKLVDTYVVILKSRTVLNEVIEKADVNYTYGQLSGMITAGAVNSTEVLRIVVTCPNPAEAERIANTIAEILPERIPDIVNGSDVRIVDYAVVPSARSSPSFTKNTAIGVLVGAILSVAAIVLTYYFDGLSESDIPRYSASRRYSEHALLLPARKPLRLRLREPVRLPQLPQRVLQERVCRCSGRQVLKGSPDPDI